MLALRKPMDRSGSMPADFAVRERDLERRAVLCAIDMRSRSDAAVWRAQAIARACGAQLLLLHVIDSRKPARSARRRSARARFILDVHARGLARWGEDVRILVRSGRPYETIAKVAVEWDADLIVLGASQQRFGDGLRGTTAERIARRARRPVLVVNRDSTMPYQHVLLAADLSRMSAGLARVTKQLGLLKRAGASVVHALGNRGRAMLYLAGARQSDVSMYQQSIRQLVSEEIDVQLFSAGLESANFKIYSPEVAPLRGIDQIAKQVGSDLVVVGSSRFPVLKRVFVGSVSHGVLRLAEQDVLLVPPAAARRVRRRAAAVALQRLEVESPQRRLELH